MPAARKSSLCGRQIHDSEKVSGSSRVTVGDVIYPFEDFPCHREAKFGGVVLLASSLDDPAFGRHSVLSQPPKLRPIERPHHERKKSCQDGVSSSEL